MRALAMTGIVTASWISLITRGLAMRATPPSARMSAGTRSSAMTATAPASSAIRACSAVVTSMITPPLSISARPPLTRIVPISFTTAIVDVRSPPSSCGAWRALALGAFGELLGEQRARDPAPGELLVGHQDAERGLDAGERGGLRLQAGERRREL